MKEKLIFLLYYICKSVILQANAFKYYLDYICLRVFEGNNNSISSYSACLKCRKF